MLEMNLAALDLNLLVALDALLAERNVTRAGQRVGLSQPAMSRALGRLRQIFNDPLFFRSGGSMAPTPQALALAAPLRQALDHIERVVAPAGELDPSKLDFTAQVVTADYMEFVLLSDLLARLRVTAPGIELCVQPTRRSDIEALLLSGAADLAFWPIALDVTELRRVPLLDEELLCIARRRHPEIRGEISLDQFCSTPHVRISPEGRGTSTVDSALAARGLEREIGTIIASHLAASRIVAATDMIAVLPARIARAAEAYEKVQVLPPPLKLAGFTVDMIWPAHHDADPRHGWLRDLIIEVASELD